MRFAGWRVEGHGRQRTAQRGDEAGRLAGRLVRERARLACTEGSFRTAMRENVGKNIDSLWKPQNAG